MNCTSMFFCWRFYFTISIIIFLSFLRFLRINYLFSFLTFIRFTMI